MIVSYLPHSLGLVYLHKIKPHKINHKKTFKDTIGHLHDSQQQTGRQVLLFYIFLLVWRSYTTNISLTTQNYNERKLSHKWKFCHYLLPHFPKAVQAYDATFPIFWNFVFGEEQICNFPSTQSSRLPFKNNAESTLLASGSHIQSLNVTGQMVNKMWPDGMFTQ